MSNHGMGRALSGVLARALIARRVHRSISTTISEADLFPGAQGTCAACGHVVEWRELYHRDAEGVEIVSSPPVRFWGDCPCWLDKIAAQAAISTSSVAADAGRLVEPVRVDIRDIQRFTLDSFDVSALQDGAKLVRAATRWLAAIEGKPAGSYHDGPPVCLFFHSEGKGRGKTHLAAAVAMEAYRKARGIAWVDEIGFIDRYWSAELEQRDSLTGYPGRASWLTVLDDMGARENTPPSLRDAWYAIINQRWLKCGWMIVTSNHTPEQLLDKGTIDDRTYSRLMQMTDRKIVSFIGDDYRLRNVRSAAA